MQGKIAPSMMCVDLMNVERDVRKLESVNVDYLHVDIMDNHFVPNITLSSDFINGLRRITNIPLDIHLMIENPENTLHLYQDCGPEDIICVHYETSTHIQRTLTMIRDMGCKVGIALNPGTPICMIEDLLEDIDMILIMTVNPGFAGQKLVPSTLNKIKVLRALLNERGYETIMIEADGNVSFENALKMHEAGADIYIAGTSSIFSKEGTLEENTRKLRDIISS